MLGTHSITAKLNSSFVEQKCPAQWKMANIVPIPKDINKHLRLVSLTPALSRIAEEFIVANCNCQKHQNYLVTTFQHHVIHDKLIYLFTEVVQTTRVENEK